MERIPFCHEWKNDYVPLYKFSYFEVSTMNFIYPLVTSDYELLDGPKN